MGNKSARLLPPPASMPPRPLSVPVIRLSESIIEPPPSHGIDPNTVDEFTLRGRHTAQLVDISLRAGTIYVLIIIPYCDIPLKISMRLIGCTAPDPNSRMEEERYEAQLCRNRLIQLCGWRPYANGPTYAEIRIEDCGSHASGHLYVRMGGKFYSSVHILLKEGLVKPCEEPK